MTICDAQKEIVADPRPFASLIFSCNAGATFLMPTPSAMAVAGTAMKDLSSDTVSPLVVCAHSLSMYTVNSALLSSPLLSTSTSSNSAMSSAFTGGTARFLTLALSLSKNSTTAR